MGETCGGFSALGLFIWHGLLVSQAPGRPFGVFSVFAKIKIGAITGSPVDHNRLISAIMLQTARAKVGVGRLIAADVWNLLLLTCHTPTLFMNLYNTCN